MNPGRGNPGPEDATACFACGKTPPDGHWFARLKIDSGWIMFCRPQCLERYLDKAGRLNRDDLWDQPEGD